MASGYHSPYYETLRDDEELPAVAVTQTHQQHAQAASIIEPILRDGIAKTAARLPRELFSRGLRKWLPKPNDPLADRKILKDAVFADIKQLLLDYGRVNWSYCPRTFSVLWMLGLPDDQIDVFMADGRTDNYLPYNEANLPDVIRGASLRARFLRLQQAVRCRREADVAELEAGGKHVALTGDVSAYFYPIKTLGCGKFAQVDQVYSCQTTRTYARKMIHRGRSVLEDRTQLAAFEKELKSLKALSHRHVVQLVGSYTHPTHLGLIMSPVADYDLHQYLITEAVDPDQRKRTLRGFFGCLVTALAYIHSERVRHKDIKPSNILVKDGQILLADFGTSRICLDGHLTTNGSAREGTPRYLAPEIMDGADRNTASDIWSLGCVFLEMATTLIGRTHEDMLRFYERRGTESVWSICLNPRATELWIQELQERAGFDSCVIGWISSMLRRNPNDRPTAAQLRGAILDARSQFDYICPHCASIDGMLSSKSPAAGKLVHGGMAGAALLKAGDRHQGESEDETELESRHDVGGAVVTTRPGPLVDMHAHRPRRTVGGKGPDDPPPPYAEEALEGKQEPAVAAAAFPITPPDSPRPSQGQMVAPAAVPARLPTPEPDSAEEVEVAPVQKKHVRFEDGGAPEAYAPDRTSGLGLAVAAGMVETSPHASTPGAGAKSFTSTTAPEGSSLSTKGSGRFTGLPSSLRPEPVHANDDGGGSAEKDSELEFVAPERLRPPPFRHQDCLPLPRASLVPSYVLAGTNHFSAREICQSSSSPGSKNIFVYGRLMFPSVLQAIAAHSTSTGVYSPMLQRRLLTYSDDWGKADCSIQRASELMTPARLQGFDRWAPDKLECAAVQRSAPHTEKILRRRKRERCRPIRPAGEVAGFLIVGLKTEAVRYLDLLFSSTEKNLSTMKPNPQDGDYDSFRQEAPLLRRESVTVEVELSDGNAAPVEACTYVWNGGSADLWSPWDEERFVRGRTFQALLEDQPRRRHEEATIARTIQISFALLGDFLVGAVFAGDMAALEAALSRRGGNCHPDAACRVYGTALQAAAAAGREDMARLLLDRGARANAKGGRYGSPLIAAACASRKAITRLLLGRGADVYATDGEHVSALYQAVGHGDYTVAEMLLEHGAWLGEEWGEVLDLAGEAGDGEVRGLLAEYDVRQMHRKYLLARPQRVARISIKVPYKTVLKAVAAKCAALQPVGGRWRGRKGVAVTVAALNAGAPVAILGLLRDAVAPIQELLRALSKCDEAGGPESGGCAALPRAGQDGGDDWELSEWEGDEDADRGDAGVEFEYICDDETGGKGSTAPG